jgi:hypothetical protein
MKSFLSKKSVVLLQISLALFFGLMTSSASAQSPPDPQRDVWVNVAVIDPMTVSDIFGKRIAQRFVTIQVTVRNKNADHQYLIHDVSLDLAKVFPNGYFANRGGSSSSRYQLSSLELSLLRGVAEKGQGQDPRNKVLRFLTAIGTVGGALVGVAGFGPSFSDSMAIFNGPVLSAYRNAFPDYTINQMNRLSDSAYQANTLVPRQQAKVLVAFVPQAIFLDKKQRKLFWDDPTQLFNESATQIDFRRTEALVSGSFIVELANLPATSATPTPTPTPTPE